MHEMGEVEAGRLDLEASGAERVGTADQLRVSVPPQLSSLLGKKVGAEPQFSAAIDKQRWKKVFGHLVRL